MVDPMDMNQGQLDSAFNQAFAKPEPETLAQTAAPAPQAPTAQPSGPVNVRTPEGELVSIPGESLQDAIKSGYRLATPDEIHSYEREQKYGSLGQQAATAAEGAAGAATFGLSTGLERLAGVPAEDIQARREVNPGSHMLGQAGGLLAGALTGSGEASLLESAGTAASKALVPGARATIEAGQALEAAKAAGQGVEAAAEAAKAARIAMPTLDRIGSAAVKGVVENGLFQSGDEVSKMLSSDPSQTIGTAMADVGMAGLIGGAFGGAAGATGKLWDSTVGPKLDAALKGISSKAGGIEGITPDPIKKAIEESGLTATPEIRAVLSGDTHLQELSRTLENSDTNIGMKHQDAIINFHNQADAGMADALGKKVNDISDDISMYERGKRLGNTLAEEASERISPLSKKYDEWREAFKDIPLDQSKAERMPKLEAQRDAAVKELGSLQRKLNKALASNSPESAVEIGGRIGEIQQNIKQLSSEAKAPGTVDRIQDDISKLIQREGWYMDPKSEIMNGVKAIQENLGNVQNLNDLSHLITQTGNRFTDFTNPGMTRVGGLLKDALRDGESMLIEQHLGARNPLALEEYAATRNAWREQAKIVEQLQDRLHLPVKSTSGFAKALREAAQTDGEAGRRLRSSKYTSIFRSNSRRLRKNFNNFM